MSACVVFAATPSCTFALSAAQTLDVWPAKPEIRSVEPGAALNLTGERNGDLYCARLTNAGKSAIHVREVALFRIAHDLPDDTALYGEAWPPVRRRCSCR